LGNAAKPREGEIINYNYPGSVSEYDMNFASAVDVIADERNELFNAISIYVPMSLAAGNIVDFDPATVTADKPAVYTCVIDNYKKIMKGRLLDQWMDVFRQDTNFSVILYLIVFLDDVSTVGMWEMDDVSITFSPLTKAFDKLFFISFIKVMFDEHYDGRPIIEPANPGTAASAVVRLTNTSASDLTVPSGNYTFNDGVKDWVIPLPADVVLPASGHSDLTVYASTVGSDAALAPGVVANGSISPTPPADLEVQVISVVQGIDPESMPTEVPSKFFDFSLALAYLCKLDLRLSYFFSLVKISYADSKPNPADKCWIRYKTLAEELAAIHSIMSGDREKYYWGALYVMGCFKNTWVLVHSEPVNIIPLILSAWFGVRNASGQYVGNKLSRLRLRGERIQPCGFPSWLNDAINENDRDGIPLFREKHVGFLRTIADNTAQESCVDSAHSLDGTPVIAQMISKWVDYNCAQECAKFITADGTLTDPVLTNEAAYEKIQDIVFSHLLLFTPTKRIADITLRFPDFSVAKTGMGRLEAASSWLASYTDELGTVIITGGIRAS
jgi:hypothetical protein